MTTAKRSGASKRPAEVCGLLEVQPYVLKFWESEFPQLGRRIGPKREYGPQEIEIAREIRRLLQDEKRTLRDARAALDERFSAPEPPASVPSPREERPGGESAARLRSRLDEALEEIKRLRAEAERVRSLSEELAAARDEIVALKRRLARARPTAPPSHRNLRERLAAVREEVAALAAEARALVDRLDT